jgi:hypothetical protein
VADLVRVLHTVTGAAARAVTSLSAPRANTYHILIGEPARAVFGPIGVDASFEQGFRVVVGPNRAGLFGQSDLATSYAIFELLHRTGCRWFFPGALGEVLPSQGPLPLPALDVRLAPSTVYRGIWYADDAWKRRNRQGGLVLMAGHALENYVKADLATHPEWVGTIGGKPHPGRIKWSRPDAADRIADVILGLDASTKAPSYSLSPGDGLEFDDSPEDRALDAGDFDPTLGQVSLTDRFLVFANRIAARVASKDPKALLGFLAYGPTTRPPIREKVNPNLVPQIAPITYDRAHPLSDEQAPGNRELRRDIEGWSARAPELSIYLYGWFLSAPVAPNPLLTKWGFDVPFVLSHGTKFWQPETLPTFESTLHALYLGMRLAFDSSLAADDVYSDLDTRLYGNAAKEMTAYWRYVDRVWVDTPEYSGGPFGQTRRFTHERLAEMRRLLDAAKRAAKTDVERRRIAMPDDSLALFIAKMALRDEFIEGRFAGLDERARAWKKRSTDLGKQYADSFAFGRTPSAPDGMYARYFSSLEEPAYDEGARIAANGKLQRVVRSFKWSATKEAHPAVGPSTPSFDDSAWKTTDVALDSWSSLGLHDWFHSVWYRAKVELTRPRGSTQHAVLWLGGGDGAFRVFVNGREARYTPRTAGPATAVGAGWFAFDVTQVIADGENTLAVLATRDTLDELGVGGLTGPVVLYFE